MESCWRRGRGRCDPLRVDVAEAEQLLRPLAGDAPAGSAVIAVRPLVGGEISAVLLVEREPPALPVVVKVSDGRPWRTSKQVYVHELMRAVPQVPVAEVLYAEPGPDRRHLVLSYLPGDLLADVAAELSPDETASVYRQLGRYLRALHTVELDAFGFLLAEGVHDPRPTNAEYFADAVARQLAGFERLGGPGEVRDAVAARFEAGRRLLDLCRVPVLCHGDLHEGNVLVVRDAGGVRVSGILDLENAVAADPLLDVAWTTSYAIQGDRVKLSALRAGYGPLGAAADDRLALYELHHVLGLWVWLGDEGRRPDARAGLLAEVRRLTAGGPAAGALPPTPPAAPN